jgi:hypothetical protein
MWDVSVFSRKEVEVTNKLLRRWNAEDTSVTHKKGTKL